MSLPASLPYNATVRLMTPVIPYCLEVLLPSCLNLVIPLDRLLVRWGHASLRRPFTFLSLGRDAHASRSPIPSLRLLLFSRQTLLPQRLPIRPMVNIVVCDPPVLSLVLGYSLILVVAWLRVKGDDVPGVEQTWDVAEGAEENIYQRICGTDATFDPN